MTANTQHADQRSKPRITIAEQPRVLDTHSGEVLGELVNLSAEGLMVAATHCIQPNTVRQMRIPLRQGERHLEIRIGAESLWCEDANDSGVHWTGFQIIDISPQDQLILDSIIGT